MSFRRFIPQGFQSFGRATLVTVQLSCILHFLTDRIGFIQECRGESMLPTLSPTGDWILYSRVPYFFPRLATPFGRGDVVIALHPFLPDRTVGKRIVGLPGDTVEVNPGDLKPVARKNSERYVKVPKGHVWLQGDNLNNSTDSRDYGPVPIALILARVEARIWPTWTSMESNVRSLDNIEQ